MFTYGRTIKTVAHFRKTLLYTEQAKAAQVHSFQKMAFTPSQKLPGPVSSSIAKAAPENQKY